MSSLIVVRFDGTPITNDVLWDGTTFTTSAGAIPGTALIRLRDRGQEHSLTIGRELEFEVDGQLQWAGYLRNVDHGYFFDADFVPGDASTYPKRSLDLNCIDFNVLFDKRVIRKTSNYLTPLPTFTIGSAKDGTLLTELLDNYVDVPAGFDTSSEMDDVAYVGGVLSNVGAYSQQGTKLREQWQKFALWSAAVYYVSPDKKWHWHGLESVVKRWGFSDQPNDFTLTADPGFQGAYRGMRGIRATEDGSAIINDALVWGGSPIGSGGAVIFDREEDSASIDEHNRWQQGETHFNEGGEYGNIDGVTARAKAIVFGAPGADALGQLKGLRYSQWQYRFEWFADRVPYVDGVHDHIRAGDLVWIRLNTFGTELLLPCRSLTMTASGLDPNGNGIMSFVGDFALNADDPWQLWSFLLSRNVASTAQTVVVTNTSTTTVLGANGQFIPSPLPDGSQTTFNLPFGYISGTLDLYLNGLLQRPGVDFIESDNVAGEFQTSFVPRTTDNLYAVCRTLAS